MSQISVTSIQFMALPVFKFIGKYQKNVRFYTLSEINVIHKHNPCPFIFFLENFDFIYGDEKSNQFMKIKKPHKRLKHVRVNEIEKRKTMDLEFCGVVLGVGWI